MAKKKSSGNGSSVYKVIELVGVSDVSWSDAARKAIEAASKTLRDLRIAEVSKLDVKIGSKGELIYRAKMSLSFKYQGD